jgi:integrase
MATVYKRGNIWWARWFDGSGKRVSASTGLTGKKKEAQTAAAVLEMEALKKRERLPSIFQAILNTAAADAAKGLLNLRRAQELVMRMLREADETFRDISLEDHLDEWISAQAAHVSQSTSKGYGEMKVRMLKALGSTVSKSPVKDLQKRQVEKAIATLAKTKASRKDGVIKGATINIDLGAFRRALAWAVENGLTLTNAAEGVRPLPEGDSDERAPFTAQEVRTLIDRAPSDEWSGAVLFGAHTGLRLGDIVKLGRINIEGTKIVIRPKKTVRSKKTLTIPLSPPLLRWISERQGDFFPTLKPMLKGTLSTTFKRIMLRAGVADRVVLPGGFEGVRSFHSLRHTFASWLAEADIHADVRQKLTGHSSAGIHARYTHHDGALDRAIQALPDLGTAAGE